MSKIDPPNFIAPDPFVLAVNVAPPILTISAMSIMSSIWAGSRARHGRTPRRLALTLKLIGSLIVGLL